MASVRVGTSGWSYKHWEKVFYPEKLPPREHLPFFTHQFSTVEINYSYYQLPPRKTFEYWRRTAPEGFLFAVKASRYLTHMRKLREPEEPLRRLMDAAGGLGPKFGPLLLQFPRRWALNLERLVEFLEALRAYPPHRYTFEFRHQSWLVPAVYEVLRSHNCALTLPVGWDIPLDVQVTADWAYIRFHGGEHGTSFEDAELRPWAKRIRTWRDDGIDTYCYFNNDALWQGRPAAIDNARRLTELIG
ncbi:MAG: DUF72 domain-containing protein [Chloroflexi bacterium]|nr:DUF72 domain-containing protein [Chloroflexota bacterium]